MAPDFPASHALRGEPVIAENLPANEQFEMPWPLEQAVASVADVVIGSDDKPFGILQAASPEVSRRFTGDDLGFLQICAELVAAAVARLEVTQSLEHTVEEKTAAVEEEEIILRELQHRIKNNFQDVLSLIHLQRRNALTGEARRQLDVLRARLQALSAVHDQVCPENAVASLKAYIQQICSNLRTFVQAEGIELDCRIDEIAVQPKTARYLGLVVNEFVTNSFEHAFPEGQGTVLVVLEPIEPECSADIG